MGYLGPLCIYAYFVVSSVINKLIMSSIAPLVVRQEKYEGDFRLDCTLISLTVLSIQCCIECMQPLCCRYHHTQVRTNAESIAFYK